MVKIQLTSQTRNLERRLPGFALLKISGWKHNPDQTQISIQRSEDEKFLGLDGQWEPVPVWQPLDNMNAVADDILEGDVGPAMVDPIINSPNNSYRVSIKSDMDSETRTMRIDGDVLASNASGDAPDSLNFGNGLILDDTADITAKEEPPVETASTTIEETPEPEPVENINNEPIEPVKENKPGVLVRHKWLILIFLILLLIALALAGAWHFKWFPFAELQNKDTNAPLSTSNSTEPTPSELNDIELLQQFMATKPSTDQILAKAKEWQENGHCVATYRLMVHNGYKSGDSRIALEYAKMYDPNLFKPGGCIEKADKDTASYWYQKAIDAGNTDAKALIDKL